jgi:hypothetical protein
MLKEKYAGWTFESFQFSERTVDVFYEQVIIPCLQVLYDRKLLMPQEIVISYRTEGNSRSLENKNFEIFKEQLLQVTKQTNQKGFELHGDVEIFTARGAQTESNAIQVCVEFSHDYVLFSIFIYSDALLPLRLDKNYQRYWNIEIWKLNKNRLFNALTEINKLDCWENFSVTPPNWWHGNVYTSGLHIFNLRSTLEEEYDTNPPKEEFDIDNYFKEMGIDGNPTTMLRKFYAGWSFESEQFSAQNVNMLYEQVIIPCLRILYERKIFIPRTITIVEGYGGEQRDLEYEDFDGFIRQLEQVKQEINYEGFQILGDMKIFTASGAQTEPAAIRVSLEFRPKPMLSIYLYSDALLPLRLDQDYWQHWNIGVWQRNKNRLFDALTELNEFDCWDEDVSLSPPDWWHGNVYASGFHIYNLRKTLEYEYETNPPKEAFDIDAYFEEMGIDGNYP